MDRPRKEKEELLYRTIRLKTSMDDNSSSEAESSENEGEYATEAETRAILKLLGDSAVPDPEVTCQCLLCPEWKSLSEIVGHMWSAHGLDLGKLKKKYPGMGQFDYIKMANWLRSRKVEEWYTEKKNDDLGVIGVRSLLFGGTGATLPPWHSDEYLFPTRADDVILTLEFDELEEEDEPTLAATTSNENGAPQGAELVSDELQTLRQINEKLICQNNTMKDTLNRVVAGDEDQEKREAEQNRKCHHMDGPKNGDSGSYRKCKCINYKHKNEDLSQSLTNGSKNEDYFETYDELNIHADMLKDMPRTLGYKRVILENSGDFGGKSVLDLGCGTGILSMFAADAGAKTIFAVDGSKMIYEAMDIIYENGREQPMKFVNLQLEKAGGRVDKVDILMSEFMGYFLLFEGMTSSYLYARDNYLKEGGKMFPNAATMYLAALSDEENYKEYVDSWDSMHGYKMTALKKKVLVEGMVQTVKPEVVVSNDIVVKELDLHTCTNHDLMIDQTFEFTIEKDCSLTSFCGYFSVAFEDGSVHKEVLSTGPRDDPTHWKQVVFYLPQKIPVVAGEKLQVEFSCRAHPVFHRWVAMKLKIGKMSCYYELK